MVARLARRSTGIRIGRTPRRGIGWWAGRVVGGLLAGLAVLAALGYLLEPGEASRSLERYPPPGELVDVGGHRLHLHCLGDGLPVVVLDAGRDGFSLYWQHVQAQLAAYTRVCVYDRAGHGWSEPGPAPRSTERLADELRALLARAGVERPYVLVGYDAGGQVALAFAGLYPRDVAGLVLVEMPSYALQDNFPSAVLRAQARQERAWRRRGTLARFGLRRVLVRVNLAGLPGWAQRLPPEQQQVVLALEAGAAGYRASLAEATAAREAAGRVGPGAIPAVPLVVVARGLAEPLRGVNAAEQEQVESLWRQAQVDLARLTTEGRLVVAAESGHAVVDDQPQLVIDTVWEVVRQARAERRAD